MKCFSFAPLLVTLSSFFLINCGTAYDTVTHKDYRMYVSHYDQRLVNDIRALIQDFNQYAGMQVLTLVDSPEESNSPITIRQIKAETGDKVGFGQTVIYTETPGASLNMGSRAKRTVRYTMNLELDEEYLRTRMDDPDLTPEQRQTNRYEKQKLFFHEVGHGLEQDHVDQENDVMYKFLNGTKYFPSFFERVRAYMRQ